MEMAYQILVVYVGFKEDSHFEEIEHKRGMKNI